MKHLFMAVLGGNCGNSNIEVHDVRFVVGETIEDCIPQLRREWYGDAKGLHLDSYTRLDCIDGYQIEIVDTPPTQEETLWFINVGGYRAGKVLEFHDVSLYVATHQSEAKRRALADLLNGYEETHRDDIYDVDNCLALTTLENHHIKLIPGGKRTPLKPTWYGYRPIDKD